MVDLRSYVELHVNTLAIKNAQLVQNAGVAVSRLWTKFCGLYGALFPFVYSFFSLKIFTLKSLCRHKTPENRQFWGPT